MTVHDDQPQGTERLASDHIAGERAGRRVLRRIADGLGHGDELLGELCDLIHDDGHKVPATPRLRAFVRVIQKAIEVRP